MARNYLNIKEYVESLLQNDLLPVVPGEEQLAYGYPDERKIFQDPVLADKQVVVVNTQDYPSRRAGQPNVIQESRNYIDNLAAAAKSLVDKHKPLDTDLKRKAIDKIAEKFKQDLIQNIAADNATGNLFLRKKSSTNKKFLRELEKAKKLLSLYTQTIERTIGHSLKELESEGHQIRSQNRATLIHRFKAPKAKEDEEQFIIYLPCARYTRRQQRLMSKENSVNRDHDTTSHHNRAQMIPGNSNLARMIVGTRHVDGSVSIHHDSFTGPGARMPYAGFKKADRYKKLALKAVTLLNQEEIIQNLAQQAIDRMTNEELAEKIPEEYLPQHEYLSRKELIGLYLRHNPLSVTECYTQVITAGQNIAAENQREQFTYVRQMMNVFDGEEACVTIQTDEDSEVEVNVKYQARMGSWGVNWFRQVGTLNPLADDRITKNQNARFINEMTSDTIKNLAQAKVKLGAYSEVASFFDLISGPDVQVEEIAIQEFKARSSIANIEHLEDLVSLKTKYRETLFDYFEEYQKDEASRDENELNKLKNQVVVLERELNRLTSEIYRLNKQIEDKRKEFFESNKVQIKAALSQLQNQISPALLSAGTSAEDKAALQHFYNSCAYLVHAQELYYEKTWHTKKNNFKLQTLAATLAEELGYANTKGCKSNNDRGQRLAQKIAGNTLWTKMSEDGLYTGAFLNRENASFREIKALDRKLTTIQALHHTANTGVSGGKFKVNKENFADNGLFGKIANLAKIKNMRPENAITKHLKRKFVISAGLGLTIAAIICVLAFIPPLTPIIAATGLGVLGIATLGIITGISVTLISFFISLLIGMIQNKLHDNKIKGFVAEGLQSAANDLQSSEADMDNSTSLHLNLGVGQNPAAPELSSNPTNPVSKSSIKEAGEEREEELQEELQEELDRHPTNRCGIC